MTEKALKIILEAVSAANAGAEPVDWVRDAILGGGSNLTFDQLGFDSISWMDFSISVELQSGQELTPGDVAQMQRVSEIAEWLRKRLPRV